MRSMFIIKKIFHRILEKLLRCFYSFANGVDESLILFEGRPDYADNPKALCEYILSNERLNKKYKIRYLVHDYDKIISLYPERKDLFLPYNNKYKCMPMQSLKAVYFAKYTFASHDFSLPYEKYKCGQKHILLWHGCGYKASSNNDGKRFFDLALVPGPLFVATKAKFWNTSLDYICPVGYPRYDWLQHPSDNARYFMNKIKKDFDKAIIWMPTFRNSKAGVDYAENKITAFPLLGNDDAWKALDLFCKERNVLLIIKLHMSQKSYSVNFKNFSNIVNITNEDFENEKINMYECLCCTDALISDYSSISIDYLVLDKPIAFALDDYELYKGLRGFVFQDPLKYMPGHHLYNFNDLMNFIDDVKAGEDAYKDARDQMKKEAISMSANFCQRLCSILGV